MTMRGILASRSSSWVRLPLVLASESRVSPVGGGSERYSVTAVGCLDSQGDGEMRFAGSGWA